MTAVDWAIFGSYAKFRKASKREARRLIYELTGEKLSGS